MPLINSLRVRVRELRELRVRVRRCLSIYPKLQIKIEIVNWRIEIVDRVHYRVDFFLTISIIAVAQWGERGCLCGSLNRQVMDSGPGALAAAYK